MKRYLALGILALLALVGWVSSHKPDNDPRPNVIIILTDDQWVGSEFAMPITQEKLWDRSMVFDHAYATTSLCCPSRAGIMTGQYGHHNGVLRNTPPHGGYASFNDTETLVVWMQRAGYRTALLGKYLNGYNGESQPTGWDEWQAFTLPPRYFGFSLNENGVIANYNDDTYSTDLLFERGIDFIADSGNQPFFLYLALYAPHAPTQVKPEDSTLFSDYVYSANTPAFNENDIADKPAYLRNRGKLNQVTLDEDTRQRLRLLPPVDRGIGQLMNYLDQSGLADNTIIIYLSDNGIMRGEHRLSAKAYPYEEAQRIPLSIYTPDMVGGSVNHSLALNIDVAPTVLELTGVSAPDDWRFDGLSLAPVLRGKHSVRKWFYIEYLSETVTPSYWGVHTGEVVSIEYTTGERECYNLVSDPYQLDNQSTSPLCKKLEHRLATVRALMQPYLTGD